MLRVGKCLQWDTTKEGYNYLPASIISAHVWLLCPYLLDAVHLIKTFFLFCTRVSVLFWLLEWIWYDLADGTTVTQLLSFGWHSDGLQFKCCISHLYVKTLGLAILTTQTTFTLGLSLLSIWILLISSLPFAILGLAENKLKFILFYYRKYIKL